MGHYFLSNPRKTGALTSYDPLLIPKQRQVTKASTEIGLGVGLMQKKNGLLLNVPSHIASYVQFL